MTSKLFKQYLDYPVLLDADSLRDLDELVETYPWFSGGQMVLARNLYNLKHIRYNKRLKIASIATVDRSLLKHFVLEENEIPIIEEPSKNIVKEAEILNQVKDSNFTQIDEVKAQQDIIESIVLSIEDSIPLEVDTLNSMDESKKAILSQDNFSLDFSFENGLLEEDNYNDSPRNRIPFEPYTQFDFTSELLKLPEIERSEIPIRLNEVDSTKTKMTFTDWLKNSQASNNIQTQNESFIIQKFIEDNPRISKPQHVDFFKPSQAAKKSLSLPNDIVTETLAVIYEKQGHFEKAILAFENLSIKYPEKSSYFAARILSLKNRLKT